MATSNSVDYNLTRFQIIHRALRLCRAVGAGETASAEEEADAVIALQAMTKHWQTRGLKLWKTTEGLLHLTKSQSEYTIGPNTSDHVALLSDAKKTEIATAASSGASTVTVDSDDDIANSDKIGVVQDDGTVHWTTVNGVPAANVVTLTAVLTDDVAVDNHVYSYTNLINRPLRITNIRRRDDANLDIPIITVARQTYWDLPNKTNTGLATQAYYDPQLSDGLLQVWPAPVSVNDRLIFTAYLPLEDFDSTDNNPDFPQEWLDALCYGLAVRLDDEKGLLNPQESMKLAAHADTLLEDLLDWDREPESIFFQPQLGWP